MAKSKARQRAFSSGEIVPIVVIDVTGGTIGVKLTVGLFSFGATQHFVANINAKYLSFLTDQEE